MIDPEALASTLIDHALVAELVPWACPCEFGPEGRYRLEELVAAGPGSLVYRATDRTLSSEGFSASVAVKIVRSRAPLRSEALSLRRVNHPGVLSVIERGTTPEGDSYLVTEFVDGGDLSQQAVPLAPRATATLLVKIARAVQAAHASGVVHCDLKPANILLTAQGEPKLADFGLSRWELDGPQDARGNIAFMSPEQYMGGPEALTPPSDLYALGGLLFYLLTGRMPLGQTAREVAEAHETQREVPSPGSEADLDRICERATRRERGQRYHSAGELADDLERWLAFEPIPWTRPSALKRLRLLVRRRPVRSVVAAAAILAVISGLGVRQYNRALDQRRQLEAQAQAVRLADERVAATSARVRRQIEWFAKAVGGQSTGDLQDQFLPALVWMQFLGESPVIQADGQIPGAEERIALLRNLIESAKQRGGDAHLRTQVARYALARLGLAQGEYDEPLRLLSDLERILGPMLSPDDPLRRSLTAMGLCAQANQDLLAGGGVSLELLGQLRAQQRLLESTEDSGETARLVQRVIDRGAAGRPGEPARADPVR